MMALSSRDELSYQWMGHEVEEKNQKNNKKVKTPFWVAKLI